MNFFKARKHIMKRLEKELHGNLYYHGIHHTIDVCDASEYLAKSENVRNEEDLILLKTAVLYHDSGFLLQYDDNEPLGVKIAREELPQFGYAQHQIDIISNLILATCIPQHPKTHLEKIICDADLDYLGRDDFYTISHKLQREWMDYGKTTTLLEWYKIQLFFMLKHQYFTETAKNLRTQKKMKHIDEIKFLLKANEIEYIEPMQERVVFKGDPDTDKIKILQSIDIFSHSSNDILTGIARMLKTIQVKNGQGIIKKGELGNCMYIIYEGNVKIHDDIYMIADLGPGKFFGEISLLDTEPRSASVTATTDSILFRLDQDDFYSILQKYPEVGREIMSVLISRLRTQNFTIINELKNREKKLQILVDERTQELREANEGLEFAYKNIKDSINYAKRIQEAILPNKALIKKALPNSFILYKPKAIVSGDFYWFSIKENNILIAAVDCTGHGVPGAFMSMIGNDQLNHIVIEKGTINSSSVLSELNRGIKLALKQVDELVEVKDGMDIAFCNINLNDKTIQFSGANRPMYQIKDNELVLHLGEKTAIGGITKEDFKFESHLIHFPSGSTFYIFSDGYCDQFGGGRDKKFTTKRFRDMILSIQNNTMQEQEQILNDIIENWKGNNEQIDDILIIGLRF